MTFLAVAIAFISINQGWVIYLIVKRIESASAEERRFLVNHLMSDTPGEFIGLAAASRPDETVEKVAESRSPSQSRPLPLGL